jgi:hypothetical protein
LALNWKGAAEMKLVEILARELSGWPDDCEAITQSAKDSEIYRTSLANVIDLRGGVNGSTYLNSRHSEPIGYPLVSREMWEAERTKLVFTDISDDFNPIINRDRIRAIDAKLKDLAEERAERIAELAAEGFALLDAVGPAGDMSDWQNWEVGDMIECVSHNKQWSGKFEIGSISVIKRIDQGHHLSMFIGYHVNPLDFKFHSRPKPC